jgi:hypothetical protein
MSRNKKDMVYTQFYEPHLRGTKFANNRVQNEQALTERMYTRMLTEACANRFKWDGLPETIDERFLEIGLAHRALMVFYFDPDYNKFMTLKASGTGELNMYDNPTRFTVTGGTMINKTLKANECVPIWSNYLRTPDFDIIYLYSRKLAEIDRTIEIAVDAMRYTTVIAADENTRHSWNQIMRQRREGQPIIFGSQALDMSVVQAFNVAPHPEALPNLLIAKSKMWNECMTLLGINNANQDKKERLVADEVAANDEQIEATRAIAMNARLQACHQINRMYGPGSHHAAKYPGHVLEYPVSVEFQLKAPAMPQLSMGEL